MKVILLKEFKGLGKAGDVTEVKSGYARNFLIPQDVALEATKGNMKIYEMKQLAAKKVEMKITQDAKKLLEKIEKLSCTISVKVGDEDKLFGSVTNSDIAKAIAEEGIEVDKKIILLEEPIKELGVYTVDVKLHHEVIAKLKVWVVKSE